MNANTKEMQELHCHACNGYVRFPIDLSMDGNYELACPNCGHIHCRVVKKGIITDERFDSRNGPTIVISNTQITYSTTSVATTTITYGGSGSIGTGDLWCSSYAATDWVYTS
jgi:hypothetical protein